ncbi:MAG: hypothetical protein IH969_02155, partial [Candidatus Krumholzibacteriota bacterium]|nr:hypothetical protein [Candidatus Krumholzibacteriota bacterium]
MKALKTATALVSVTDKSGLVELGAAFKEVGIRILASSGTKTFLEGEGIEAEEISARGQRLFDRIERLSAPTVAVIHGPCLGGGWSLPWLAVTVSP